MPARFTYVYERDGDNWKILTHHSSVLPESATLAFYAWNDALQTKDPAKVATMYITEDGKTGVLLPTISNKVRYSRATQPAEPSGLQAHHLSSSAANHLPDHRPATGQQ